MWRKGGEVEEMEGLEAKKMHVRILGWIPWLLRMSLTFSIVSFAFISYFHLKFRSLTLLHQTLSHIPANGGRLLLFS